MESFFEYEVSQQSVQEVWDDPETIFVVDTNIFLNIYVFHQETRQAIYDALDKIKERLWSPHQVMLEFHRNRAGKIQESKKRLDKIGNYINKFIKQFKFTDSELTQCDNEYGKWYPSIREHLTIFQKNAQAVIKKQFEELEKTLEVEAKMLLEELDSWKKQIIPSVTEDSIYQKLCEFYSDDKIGKPFTQLELDALYKEGEWRFQHDMPPGYKDKEKFEIYHYRGSIYHSKFGDLILYKQILEYCKAHKIKNVIFISEDNAKGDWAYKDTKALRKEIRGEAFEVAGIRNFIMMNKDSLLTYSKVDKSPQVQEDFDRADNEQLLQYGDDGWSNIGIKIYEIVQNNTISIEDKITLLEKIKGSAISFPEIYLVNSALISKDYFFVYKVVTYDRRKYLTDIVTEINRIIKESDLSIADKVNILEYLCDDIFSFTDQVGLRMYLEEHDDVNAMVIVLKCLSSLQSNKDKLFDVQRRWEEIQNNPNKKDQRDLLLAEVAHITNSIQNLDIIYKKLGYEEE